MNKPPYLGQEGTEQFTVETRVDGKTIRTQRIHDPFIRSTTTVGLSRLDHLRAIFRKRQIKVEVVVNGSEGANRAVMTLNPAQLQRDTEEILRERVRDFNERMREGAQGLVGTARIGTAANTHPEDGGPQEIAFER